jgi:hypothetical protein
MADDPMGDFAKYYQGGGAVGIGVVSGLCLGHGAAAYDPGKGLWSSRKPGCWLVAGQKIVIADTIDSVMAGFERMNHWMHVCGTQKCCVDSYQLPGAVAPV